MAIPTPTIPSAVETVSAVALKPTLNNRAFHINSGLISADNTETTVISVNDIGKRDILFCINPILTSAGSDNMTMKVKNNGSVIYQAIYDNNYENYKENSIHFIIPANTSIEITFTNSDSSSHDIGISAYGYFMEAN
jgi:hypothetical protein